MTLFRLRYKQLGGHTHVRVFAGKGSLSLAHCGQLVFRNEEWADFLRELARPGNIEELPEEDDDHAP